MGITKTDDNIIFQVSDNGTSLNMQNANGSTSITASTTFLVENKPIIFPLSSKLAGIKKSFKVISSFVITVVHMRRNGYANS